MDVRRYSLMLLHTCTRWLDRRVGVATCCSRTSTHRPSASRWTAWSGCPWVESRLVMTPRSPREAAAQSWISSQPARSGCSDSAGCPETMCAAHTQREVSTAARQDHIFNVNVTSTLRTSNAADVKGAEPELCCKIRCAASQNRTAVDSNRTRLKLKKVLVVMAVLNEVIREPSGTMLSRTYLELFCEEYWKKNKKISE